MCGEMYKVFGERLERGWRTNDWRSLFYLIIYIFFCQNLWEKEWGKTVGFKVGDTALIGLNSIKHMLSSLRGLGRGMSSQVRLICFGNI